MLLKRTTISTILQCCFFVVLLLSGSVSIAAEINSENIDFQQFQDTTIIRGNDSLHYPISDRRGDYLFGGVGNTYDLKSPSNSPILLCTTPLQRDMSFTKRSETGSIAPQQPILLTNSGLYEINKRRMIISGEGPILPVF